MKTKKVDIGAEKWTLKTKKVDIGAEKWTFRKASHEKGTEKSCDFFGVAVCMILTMGIRILPWTAVILKIRREKQ